MTENRPVKYLVKPQDRAAYAEYGIRFLLAFILAGARIFDTLSPFSIGLIAAAGGGVGGAITMAGGILGYLVFGSFAWAAKYIAIAILVLAVTVVFRETDIFTAAWFMPLVTALICASVGLITAAVAGWRLYAVAGMMTDTVLAGGCAYFYKSALSPWSGRLNFSRAGEVVHTVSILVLISTLLISLAGLVLFNVVSVGRTVATLLVFLAAYKGGLGLGCATGICVGLAMDSAMGGAPFFSTAYGMAGIVAGLFSQRSRLAFALAFIAVDAAAALLSLGSAGVPAILYETFIASVVFMVLPHSFMARLGALMPQETPGSGISRAREYTRNRVDQASLAFRDLYETVQDVNGRPYNDENIATVFDRAAESVCRTCARSADCWQRDYQSTVDIMNNATPKMLERGRLEASDLPAYFTDTCRKLPQFVAAVSSELKGLLYRRQYRSRLQMNRSAAFNQYSDISEVLSGISEELGGGIGFEPELETRLQKYLQSLGLTPSVAVFRDKSTRLHAEISGVGIPQLRRDPLYLEKLSAVLGMRLCASEQQCTPDKLVLLEAEPLAASVGISCVKKRTSDMSGDRGAYFKTDDGVLHVILSDGMGSGEAAARYSSDAVRILERFIRAGVAAETAVRMLNDLMLLKNEDDTGCATVDLFSINLFSGETKMYKYGAAPSYLRRAGEVRRVKGKSLAAGLGAPPHDTPDRLKMDLCPGAVAVIISDGVLDSADDEWLRQLILQWDGSLPRELSTRIVDAAIARSGGEEDDMTVIVIQVTERQ